MKKKIKRNCSYVSVGGIGVAVALISTFILSLLFATAVNDEKLTISNLELYGHIIRVLGILVGSLVVSRLYPALRYNVITAVVYILVLMVIACLMGNGLGGTAPLGIAIAAISIILFSMLQKLHKKGRRPRSAKQRTG